jgi:hypothetical protein
MTLYYPARDGHPSMFALDNAATVEAALISLAISPRRREPDIPESPPAKADSPANRRRT